MEKKPDILQGGFCYIFPCYQKLMGKTMHFPCGKVYHKMGNLKEEKYSYFGESMGTNFPDSPNSMDFAAFSYAMGN